MIFSILFHKIDNSYSFHVDVQEVLQNFLPVVMGLSLHPQSISVNLNLKSQEMITISRREVVMTCSQYDMHTSPLLSRP